MNGHGFAHDKITGQTFAFSTTTEPINGKPETRHYCLAAAFHHHQSAYDKQANNLLL